LFAAVVYLAVGVILAVTYFLLPNPPHADEAARVPRETDPKEDYNRRKLEYETLNSDINARGEGAVLAGTIFVTASVLILAQATSGPIVTRIILCFASMTIYSIWLFGIYYTARRLDALTYSRLHEIEARLRIDAHAYVRRIADDTFWFRLRSNIWAVILLALSFVGFLILLQTCY
jgi:hypothetical protein